MDCRIGHWNLGRGKVATDEAVKRCIDERIDVLLIQEPYVKNRRVRMTGGRIYHDRSGREDIWCAIYVRNDEIGVIMDTEETNGTCVSVRLEQNGEAIKVVSLYCRPSEPIDGHLRRLADIVRRANNKDLFCGGDLNAKSRLWLSRRTDVRGSKVEEVIMAWDLQVLNQFSRWPTFENTQGGKSNINVTLTTRDVARKCMHWRVHEDTISEHRLITTDLQGGSGRRTGDQPREGTFDLRNVNWRELDHALLDKIQEMETEGRNVNEHAQGLVQLITGLMEEHFPKVQKRQKKVYWWTEELGRLRSHMRRMHRCWTRTRQENDRRRFVSARTSYIWEVRKQKMKKWEQLIAEEEGDPWGRVYKILTEKTKKETQLVSLEKEDGSYTETVQDTLKVMLEGLLRDDREEEDSEEQRELRMAMQLESAGENEAPFTEDEMTSAIKKMKDRKAPGVDGIKSEVIKRMHGRLKGKMLELYNRMLEEGLFPDVWKKGILKVFLKSEDKDPSLVKSYRPVTLLPVLGKIAERMLVKRLKEWMDRVGRTNACQYGFTEGVGTVDALIDMKKEVETCEEKYVAGLFLDISGAFDSAWWPEVLRVLREWRCPGNVYRLIRDYFKNRTVTLKANSGQVSKVITKGCPQGSVVGPLLWNVLFDGFLRLPFEEGISARAYADDGLLLVKANSRPELMRKCTRALNMVMRWGEERKMTFSKEKTVMLLLKGKLVERFIRAEMGEAVIRCSEETKYLGVVIRSGMKFTGHYEKTIEKTLKAFGKLKGLAKANGGMNCETLRRLYIGALEPMVLYGCEMWGQRMKGRGEKTKLMSLQRKLLLGVTKGYSTISHEAIRVIAGVIPIDLMVEERIKRRTDKENGIEDKESKKLRREETILTWQRRWETSTKGRETFAYIPDVRQRKRVHWVTDHYTTQFVSGHGNFKAKLHGFNLVPSDRCDHCEEVETAQHVLMECAFYEEERTELKDYLHEQGWHWRKSSFLRSKEVAAIFTRTCRRIGQKKRRYEDERR